MSEILNAVQRSSRLYRQKILWRKIRKWN